MIQTNTNFFIKPHFLITFAICLVSAFFLAEPALATSCPDFNGDLKVDKADSDIFSASYGAVCMANYNKGYDFDLDGDIDQNDLAKFSAAFGSIKGQNANYDSKCDFDLDGDVDGSDLAKFSAAYGSTCALNYNAKCDFDSDRDVDGSDSAYFSQFYGSNVDANCNITCNNNKVCDANENYNTCPSDCPAPQIIKCGDTITKNTVLNNDLLNCLYGGLKIYQENITLDCNGHKITGSKGAQIGAGTGIRVFNATSTIQNCVISGFENGILLSGNAKSIVENNTIQENKSGIYIFSGYDIIRNNKIINNKKDSQGTGGDGICNDEGSYITIENNVISNNAGWGINLNGHVGHVVSGNTVESNPKGAISAYAMRKSSFLNNKISGSKIGIDFSSNLDKNKGYSWTAKENTFSGNQFNSITYPLMFLGRQYDGYYCPDPKVCSLSKDFCDFPECYNNTIDTSNTVNGKPMYYLYKKSNQTYENLDAGYFACMECDNITLKNVKTEPNYFGFFFYRNNNLNLDNLTAKNNKFGVYLAHSTSTSIANSTVEKNSDFDIYNIDQEQAKNSNCTCGLGMCYDPVHKVCPCAIKSSYYVQISDSSCPDLDADGDVDANDETLFNKAYPSQCDKKYDPRPDLDKDGDVDSGDLTKCISAFGSLRGDSKYNAQCDFDNDGDVDGSDQAITTNAYGTICHLNFNAKADLNGDTKIDETDKQRFIAYWGEKVNCGLVATAPLVNREYQLETINADAATITIAPAFEVALRVNEKRDLNRESQIYSKYVFNLQGLGNITEKSTLINFISYGTETTKSLGTGERASVVKSFQSAFGKLPKGMEDWQDIIKIANGRWPTQRNETKEKQAERSFKIIYKRIPNRNNPHDNAAVTIMTYGLRPNVRNLASEKVAILSFQYIFKSVPSSAVDWDIVRAIAHSGAKR